MKHSSAGLTARKNINLLLLSVALLVTASPALLSAGERRAQVELENAGGVELLLLFVSGFDSDFLGPDVLGADRSLPAGERITFDVHLHEECFRYDFVGVNVEGEMVMSVVELCEDELHEVALGAEGKLADSPPLEPFLRIDVINSRDAAIEALYASAVDGRFRGANLLSTAGNSALAEGDRASFFLARSEAVTYQIIVRDEHGETRETQLHLDEFRESGAEVLQVEIEESAW